MDNAPDSAPAGKPLDEQTLVRLQAAVDGELNPLGQAWLAERLAVDRALSEELATRQLLADRLRQRLMQQTPPTALDDARRARIHQQARRPQPRGYFGTPLRAWHVVAACLVIGMAGLLAFPASSMVSPTKIATKIRDSSPLPTPGSMRDGDGMAATAAYAYRGEPLPGSANSEVAGEQRLRLEGAVAPDGDGNELSQLQGKLSDSYKSAETNERKKGREEAVADANQGGAGSFPTIGPSSGGRGSFGQRPLTAAEPASELSSQGGQVASARRALDSEPIRATAATPALDSSKLNTNRTLPGEASPSSPAHNAPPAPQSPSPVSAPKPAIAMNGFSGPTLELADAEGKNRKDIVPPIALDRPSKPESVREVEAGYFGRTTHQKNDDNRRAAGELIREDEMNNRAGSYAHIPDRLREQIRRGNFPLSNELRQSNEWPETEHVRRVPVNGLEERNGFHAVDKSGTKEDENKLIISGAINQALENKITEVESLKNEKDIEKSLGGKYKAENSRASAFFIAPALVAPAIGSSDEEREQLQRQRIAARRAEQAQMLTDGQSWQRLAAQAGQPLALMSERDGAVAERPATQVVDRLRATDDEMRESEGSHQGQAADLSIAQALAMQARFVFGEGNIETPLSPFLTQLGMANAESSRRAVSLTIANDTTLGQALMQGAQVIGQQVRFSGGVLSLTTPRPLDPSDTGGLSQAQFQEAWNTTPMLSIAERADQTFAFNGDSAAFRVAQQALLARQRPNPTAMRPEQFVNAVPVSYAPPTQDAIAMYAEASPHPLLNAEQSARTALVAVTAVTRAPSPGERRPLRCVVCIDVSGSMARPGALSSAQQQLRALLGRLQAGDQISVVAFAERARVALPPTPADRHAVIAPVIDGLHADGPTNAIEGLRLAFQMAGEQRSAEADTTVLLLTDGATMAGGALAGAQAITQPWRGQGLTLIVAAVGETPSEPKALQELAERADGRFVIVGQGPGLDQQLLPERLTALVRDAKCQVVWNEQRVSHARLVGYEQHRLKAEDFRNNAVDAAELSASMTVTALFEVVLIEGGSGALGTARVRYADVRARGAIREMAMPLSSSLIAPVASQRLRLWAVSAATGELLQSGWWANCRAWNARALADQLTTINDSALQPHAAALRTMLTTYHATFPAK